MMTNHVSIMTRTITMPMAVTMTRSITRVSCPHSLGLFVLCCSCIWANSHLLMMILCGIEVFGDDGPLPRGDILKFCDPVSVELGNAPHLFSLRHVLVSHLHSFDQLFYLHCTEGKYYDVAPLLVLLHDEEHAKVLPVVLWNIVANYVRPAASLFRFPSWNDYGRYDDQRTYTHQHRFLEIYKPYDDNSYCLSIYSNMLAAVAATASGSSLTWHPPRHDLERSR